MKKRRRLTIVAALLVAAAVADFVVFAQLESTESVLLRGWRLFLTVVIAVFLAGAKNTARWLAATITGLAGLATFVALSVLMLKGGFASMPRPILSWLCVTTILYTTIAAFLALSPGVTREIRRAAGKI